MPLSCGLPSIRAFDKEGWEMDMPVHMTTNQNTAARTSAPALRPRPWAAGALALATAVLVAACGGGSDGGTTTPAPNPTPAPAQAQPLDLTILHINDHHSTLESRTKALQLSAGGSSAVAVSVDAGGFPRVAAAIGELAAQSANVLKLHAGDALTGTLYFNRAGANGEADAALMNTVCFDAFTLGNHEFDKGDSGLKGFIDLLHKGSCKTPVLSANVRFGANSALNPS